MELKVDGGTINYEVTGPQQAPAVLLWHGAGCTLHMWDLVVDRLKDRYRLIPFDVRGVGGSSPTEDPATQYSFEQYADDACRILDTLGVTSCHVWSMAWGSRAALAYCSIYPERVISAALYDASIGKADVEAQQEGGKRALARQIKTGIEPFRRPNGWRDHTFPDQVPLAMGAAAKFDLPGAVHKLTMPVLVATGDHDPNLASSRELVSMLQDGRLVVFENVGHGSVLQRPDLTTAAFLEFQDAIQA